MKKLSYFLEEIEGLEILTGPSTVEIEHGYVSDLLSDVMRNARSDSIWVTIQHHENVVAVALMADIPVISFANDITPEQEVIERADEEGITICRYPKNSFELVGKLYQLGIKG